MAEFWLHFGPREKFFEKRAFISTFGILFLVISSSRMKQGEVFTWDDISVNENEERWNRSNKNERLLFVLSSICSIFAR